MTTTDLKNKKADLLARIKELNNPAEDAAIDFESIDLLKTEVETINKQIANSEYMDSQAQKRADEKRISDEKLAGKAAKFANVTGKASTGEEKEEESLFEKFMFTKAFQQIEAKRALEGVEREVHEMASKEAVEAGTKVTGNIGIPQKMIRFPGLEARRKQVTVGVEGGNIVQTDFGPKIPLLEIDPAVIRAGARVFTGLQGDLQFPRNATGAVLNWEGEVDPAQETTPTYDNIKLIPNRLAGYTDYSIQAGIQANFDLEADLRERLSRAWSIEWDRVALLGSGAGNEPLGIINTVGVGVIPTDVNTVTWDVALAYPAGLNQANVPQDGRQAYMGPAVVKSHLMGQPKDAGSGLFVMNDAGSVAGYPFHMDNNLPIDGGVGTNEATMVFGRWDSLYLGQWAGMSILFDPYTQSLLGTNRLVLNSYLDVQIEWVEAFNYSDDIIP